MALNQDARALASLRRAAALKRDDDVVQYYIGEVLRQQCDLAGAVAAYDQASRINAAETAYHRKAGETLLMIGRAAEAEMRFRTVLSQDPHSSTTLYNMSQALVAQGKYDEALANAIRALELKPGSALFNFQAGFIQERRGKTDEAIRLYLQAISVDASYPEPLINLGGLYTDKGLLDKALELLSRAYQLAPNSYQATNNLGNVYVYKGMYERGISLFLKAIALKGDAGAPRYNLGIAYLETGRDAEATRTLLELIKIEPTFWDGYFQLAKVLIRQGDRTTAKSLLETLLRKKPDYRQKAEADALLATVR
jgi:tetratricopeptide (TPR) repeat protein